MTIMRCENCGQYGIYWKNLTGLTPYTYCPKCENVNCQIPEEKTQEEEVE